MRERDDGPFNSQPDDPILDVRHVSKCYGAVRVLQDVSVEVRAGEFIGIIGPNGSGKSTLLSLISGVEQPDAGEVVLEGRLVSSYSRKALTRKLAVLQQDGLPSIGYCVREVIEMGRFPFQNWMGRDENNDSDQLIFDIMDRLELHKFANRSLNRLSGGQRQRVALAKVMAQQPDVVLLDEPTTYLDIRYQMQFMDLVSQWRNEQGLTVVSVMHDLNLAALYCDRLVILNEGSVAAEGSTEQILSPALIESVFQVKSHTVVHPDAGVPQLLLQRGN